VVEEPREESEERRVSAQAQLAPQVALVRIQELEVAQPAAQVEHQQPMRPARLAVLSLRAQPLALAAAAREALQQAIRVEVEGPLQAPEAPLQVLLEALGWLAALQQVLPLQEGQLQALPEWKAAPSPQVMLVRRMVAQALLIETAMEIATQRPTKVDLRVQLATLWRCFLLALPALQPLFVH
jgi:hypothetical protein